MKKLFTLIFFGFGISSFVSAQMLLDKQLQMTGGADTDRRITNVGDPTSEKDAVNAGVIQKNALTYAAATGSGGNYVITLTPAPASYTAGMIVNFKANHNNTGAATLKVGTLAAMDIKTGVINDLAADAIADNQMVSVMFDGTNFQLLSGSAAPASLPPSGAAGGDLTGTYPNPDVATNAVTTNEIANGTIAAVDLANTGVGAGTYNNVTVNAQGQVTAGSVVTYLTTETDGSITNEGLLSVGAGSGTTSLIQSNTSSSTVTLTAGTGLGITENTGTGTITLTNSNPDQTVSITGAGINVVTGTYPNFTITGTELDGSPSNEGALTVEAGVATTAVVRSSPHNSTVTFTAGTGLTVGETTGANGTVTFNLGNTPVTPATYTSVTVNQQGQVTAGTNPAFPTGTGAAGHITYWTGASTQSFDNGQLSWDATNNLMGLGTASPNAGLTIRRNNASISLQVADNTFHNEILFQNAAGVNVADILSSVTTTTYGAENGGLSFFTGSSFSAPRMTIKSGGDVIVSNLAGTGNRLVHATSNGTLVASTSTYNTTFVHWGQAACPSATSTTIYSGYAVSGPWDQGGSGRNYLCLTDAPSWSGTTTPNATQTSGIGHIFGVEYETGGGDNNVLPGFGTTLNERDAVCSVCMVTNASSTLMIPGTTLCPTDWTRQYWGWLMANRSGNGANGSDFVCVVNNPTASGSSTNSNGALWWAVEIRTGALAGTYSSHDGREVSCAVCTR